MTAASLDRALESVLQEPYVEFVLLQGPGGAIVASAGPPPRWAPEGAPDTEADPWGRVEASPDVVLEVGLCHVVHVDTTREITRKEEDRIRSLFAPAL